MRLRSLRRDGSCPDSAAYPTSCRPRGAVGPPLASAPTCHQRRHPPRVFFVASHATIVSVGCLFANFASVPVEAHSSKASLRSRPPLSPQHPTASSLSVSRRLVPPSAL